MINLTLFVQVIHFWIAYLILDKVVLRLAVELIQRENSEDASLRRTIDEVSEELSQMRIQKEHNWRHFQEILRKQAPPLNQTLQEKSNGQFSSKKFVPISTEEVAQLGEYMQGWLINRITHD